MSNVNINTLAIRFLRGEFLAADRSMETDDVIYTIIPSRGRERQKVKPKFGTVKMLLKSRLLPVFGRTSKLSLE